MTSGVTPPGFIFAIMPSLQTLLDDISCDALPFEWATFDFAVFSQTKALWDCQQTTLQNAPQVAVEILRRRRQ